MNPRLTPLRLRPFRRLLAAYCVNSLGTWMGEIALSVVVLHATGSAAAVASVWIVGLFLPTLAGPFLVARIERVPTRIALPALLLGEALLFAGIAAVVIAGFSLAAVLVLAALDGALALVARALLKASVAATTTPAGLLREGNAIFTGVFTVTMAGGPLLAGVVIAAVSPAAALLADAVSFGLAALFLALESGLRDTRTDGSGRPKGVVATAIRVRRVAGLSRLLSGYGAVCVLGAAVLPVEILLVQETLGGSEASYGAVLALWGTGAVAGGLLLPFVKDRSLTHLVAVSFFVFAVSYAGMGIAGSIAVVCLFSFIGGSANGIVAFAVTTAVQERTPVADHVRIGGFVESLVSGATGTGYVLGGVIATAASARAVYLVAGIGIAVAAVLILAPERVSARARPGMPVAYKPAG